jgi:hypothetical protein
VRAAEFDEGSKREIEMHTHPSATEVPLPASWEADQAERNRQKAEGQLTLGQRQHLTRGKIDEGLTGFATLDELQAAWERHAVSVLAQWANRVGIRPAGWWICCFPCADEYPASDDPLHFGRFVPALEDQPGILAVHDLLRDDELEAAGIAAGTIG